MSNNSAKAKEPFVHLTKRKTIETKYKVLIKACAVILAALIILLIAKLTTNESLSKVFRFVKSGAFGSSFAIEETFMNVSVLLCLSIALAPAFKMRFWNVGAQGQALFGALCAGIIARYLGGKIPETLLLILMFIGAVAGGGFWALIPAFCKVKLGANETLFTLMMNYVAIQLIACFSDLWKGRDSALSPSDYGHLPAMFGLTYGFTYIAGIVLVILMFIYLRKTKQGYEITVVGESMNTARYAGINTGKVTLRTLFISGAICGLVGFLYIGNVHKIADVADLNFGFTAIIVAWASHFNTFIMSLVSFAIVFLQKGARGMVDNCDNLNESIGDIFVGIFLFILIGCEFFINYKLHFNFDFLKSKKKGSDNGESSENKDSAKDQQNENKEEVSANV